MSRASRSTVVHVNDSATFEGDHPVGISAPQTSQILFVGTHQVGGGNPPTQTVRFRILKFLGGSLAKLATTVLLRRIADKLSIRHTSQRSTT